MTYFLDSVPLIALVDRRDQYHPDVTRFMAGFDEPMLTTEWVFTECLNSLSGTRVRTAAYDLVERFRCSPGVKTIAYENDLHRRGLALYRKRPDKAWSLTDCISFVAMEQHKLSEALTADHHFRQAGFHPIFEQQNP